MIILAAGSSSRLGQPKQLVVFEDETLLQRTINLSSSVNFNAKVLVLGADHKSILKQTNTMAFDAVINEDWREGMASSLTLGLEAALKEQPNLECVMIAVCDQPYLTTGILIQLIEKYESIDQLVACQYGNQPGVPAIFGRTCFEEIFQLEGDKGAKSILLKHLDRLTLIDFEKGSFDIDTPEDLDLLGENEV